MSKHFTKILAIVMVLATLVTMFAVPASAAGYYMACTIYYKDEAGNQVATTKTFSMNAADTTAQNKQYAWWSVGSTVVQGRSCTWSSFRFSLVRIKR